MTMTTIVPFIRGVLSRGPFLFAGVLLVGPTGAVAGEPLYPAQLLTQEAFLREEHPDVIWQGHAVALEGDTAVVAAPRDSREQATFAGAVYIYKRVEGAWVLDGRLPGGQQWAFFGHTVAISEDETTVVVGHPDTGGSMAGAVHIYVRGESGWEHQQTMSGSGSLGDSVAISGNTLAIWRDLGLPGVVDIYVRSGGTWYLQQELTASDSSHNPVVFNNFGISLALEGDRLVVGADLPDENRGAAYYFERSGSTWTELQKIVPTEGADETYRFGLSSALEGDRLVIGAVPETGDPEGARPAAFVYHLDGTTWTEIDRLVVDESDWTGSSLHSQFGVSVALTDGTVLAGAPQNGGYVYFFSEYGDGYSMLHRMDAPAGAGWFGGDLAAEGETLLVGAKFFNGEKGAAYVYEPDFGDAAAVASLARRYLFYEDALVPGGDTGEPPSGDPNEVDEEAEMAVFFPRDSAAFRFLPLLYEPDPDDDLQRIRARFDNIGNLYGADEEARALTAAELVERSLRENPDNDALGDLLLDIVYNRTLARVIDYRNHLEEAEETFLAPPSTPGGLIIDDEVNVRQAFWDGARDALAPYFELLRDDLGSASEPPLGYQIFRDRVPERELAPARFLDGGELTPVDGESDPLMDGYKDLGLLFELLRDHNDGALRLAELYWGRGTGNDHDNARSLLAEARRFGFLHGTILREPFPDLYGDTELPPGLEELIDLYLAGLDEMVPMRRAIESDVNPLGFDSDFLMLVQRFPGESLNLFDSYDSFNEWLDPDDSTSPLGFARDRYEQAQDSLDTYLGYEDQLEQQLASNNIATNERLYEIVGADFYPDPEPHYSTPHLNVGSEIWQQVQTIERARLQIQRNQTEINNLEAEVRIEIERRGQARDIANAIDGVRVEYAEKQAKITREIGEINAIQGASSSLAQALDPASLASGASIGLAADGIVQAATGNEKAKLEERRDRYAAIEQLKISSLEQDLLDVDSQAHIKTLLLNMSVLAIDSQENAITLRQETGRLVALMREKERLENTIRANAVTVGNRYFANPVHRLRAQHDTAVARFAFRAAQQWLFFTARALEYKWNRPFVLSAEASGDDREWQTSDLFALRNTDELERYYVAMRNFNALLQATRREDDRFDWISVREHLLGYVEENDEGEPLYYEDTETGEMVTAIEAFRRHLLRRQDTNGVIRLELNTVRQIPNSTFFLGPRFLPDGQIDESRKGLYLDKIRWMLIRLPGGHTTPGSDVVGSLGYGGTSYIRNNTVGQTVPDRPDRLVDEMTPYRTQFWFFDTDNQIWRARENQISDGITMQKADRSEPRFSGSPSEIADIPLGLQINTFKERSVAASRWQLTLPTRSGSTTYLRVSELDDIEIFFYHYATDRD